MILFGLICVIQIVALRLVNAGSQWYTATGSLFLGVLLAGHPVSIKKKSRHILNFIVSWCIFTVSGIVSKLYVDYSTIKDCFTCISGMAFCFGMLVLFEEIEKLGLLKLLHFLQCIGNASLWGYILHMKVLYLLCRYVGRINVVIYIASVCFAMMIFDATWKRIIFVNRKLQWSLAALTLDVGQNVSKAWKNKEGKCSLRWTYFTKCMKTRIILTNRQSNLELYRIIFMYLIVLHYYVVNSGLADTMQLHGDFPKNLVYAIAGGWGKIGINCFVLITGYFMCKSSISGLFIKMWGKIPWKYWKIRKDSFFKLNNGKKG